MTTSFLAFPQTVLQTLQTIISEPPPRRRRDKPSRPFYSMEEILGVTNNKDLAKELYDGTFKPQTGDHTIEQHNQSETIRDDDDGDQNWYHLRSLYLFLIWFALWENTSASIIICVVLSSSSPSFSPLSMAAYNLKDNSLWHYSSPQLPPPSPYH